MEMLLYQVIAMFVQTGPDEGAIPEGLVVEIAEFLTPRAPFSFVQTDAREALAQFLAEHTPSSADRENTQTQAKETSAMQIVEKKKEE